jgi:hypothetical protein
MAGAYAAGETHFLEDKFRAGDTQIAGFEVIVLDASIVVDRHFNRRDKLGDRFKLDL